MPFKDYEKVATPPLQLPIGGKVYTIKPLGIADGLKISGALRPVVELDDEGNPVGPTPDPMGNVEFFSTVLGDAYAEMLADNVPAPALARAALTAWTDHDEGRGTAEVMWETGSIPELLAAYMAAVKSQTTSTDSTPSPDSDEASEDQTAPTSGTSSPPATQP